MKINKKSCDANEKKYRKYLEGKRVALVGPSASLVGQGKGKEIDAFDVVVRINNSYPIPESQKDEIGSRTDVLYHTCGRILKMLKKGAKKRNLGRIAMLKKEGVNWFVAKHHPIESPEQQRRRVIRFINLNKKDEITVVPMHLKFLLDMQKVLNNTEPNTGFLSIMHLLDSQLASLDVFGCDFYATGYYPGYNLPEGMKWDDEKKKVIRKDGKKRRTPTMDHNNEIQIRFLLGLLQQDKRLTIHADLEGRL